MMHGSFNTKFLDPNLRARYIDKKGLIFKNRFVDIATGNLIGFAVGRGCQRYGIDHVSDPDNLANEFPILQTRLCSQGGVKFPTGGMQLSCEPASAFLREGSSRSGEMPEPTVIVRMEENARHRAGRRVRSLVIALGECVDYLEEITMTHTRYAFIKARWHGDIVDRALHGFCELIPEEAVDVYDVPGAFELPLLARDLAATKRYAAVIAAAFVVDGGIYRHEFVGQAVIDGLMRASMDSNIPVLSVSLTPHQYQETEHHKQIYREHFVEKGREAAEAALMIGKTRALVAA